jgi:predicted amidohydrolase YtcJ
VATGIHTNDDDAWQLYSQIQRDSGLPLRVYLTPLINELKANPSIPKAGSRDGLLSCDRIKIFGDGSLGAVGRFLSLRLSSHTLTLGDSRE